MSMPSRSLQPLVWVLFFPIRPQKLSSSMQLQLRSHQPQLSGPRSAQREHGNLSLNLLSWVGSKKFKKMKNGKKNSYTFFFSFLSSSLTRGTKETWAPGDMDHPAQLTSYLPAMLGINGEVKCYRATLPRTPKNVCVPNQAPSVQAPFTPHIAASGSQRAWHRGFAFQELIEKFLWTHVFAHSLSWWFSFFLYFYHNGLSTVFGCCVHVARPTQGLSLS